MKVGFWNVAGLSKKGADFYREIEEWDIVCMVETWVERKNWEKIKKKLSKDFTWKIKGATRKGKRGRARGC